MIDGQQIVALIEAADLDEALQKLVGKAMLR
jgi:hypothetical protein